MRSTPSRIAFLGRTTLALAGGCLQACGGGEEGELSPRANGAPAVFAQPSGQSFDGQLEVRLIADPSSEVFYTLNGHSPHGDAAERYDGPIMIYDDALLSFVARSLNGQWSTLGSELYQKTMQLDPYRPPLRGLQVSDDSLFFAANPGDEILSQTVEIRSVGTAPVRFNRVFVGAQGAFFEPDIFIVPDFEPMDLRPGEKMDIEVRYRVTNSLRTAALVLDTNDLRARDGLWVITLGGKIAAW